MTIIHLYPISSFKGSMPRSDTLFGALCWAIRTLYGEHTLETMLERFHPLQADSEPNPPFLLSSAFPFLKSGNEYLYFFPKPKGEMEIEKPRSLCDIRRLKDFKRVKYVSKGVFNRLLKGELDDMALFNRFLSDRERREKLARAEYEMVQVDSLLVERDLVEQMTEGELSISKSVDIPRNAINRLSGSVEEKKLFFNRELFLSKASGIFFLMDFRDEEWRQKVFACWRFLGDRGIGGDVSVGKGQFSVRVEEKELFQEPPHPTRFTTLSLFFSEENLTGEEVHYNLVKRKGKIESAYHPTTDIWKHTVLMYEEGSVFPLKGKDFYGENPIVKRINNINVQQYGFAFPVRMV